jgi:hypothetical protein
MGRGFRRFGHGAKILSVRRFERVSAPLAASSPGTERLSASGDWHARRRPMISTKHDKSQDEGPFASDLEQNPGIGQSKGIFARESDPDAQEGANTVEGDVENDPAPAGGVVEHHLGRTNK